MNQPTDHMTGLLLVPWCHLLPWPRWVYAVERHVHAFGRFVSDLGEIRRIFHLPIVK